MNWLTSYRLIFFFIQPTIKLFVIPTAVKVPTFEILFLKLSILLMYYFMRVNIPNVNCTRFYTCYCNWSILTNSYCNNGFFIGLLKYIWITFFSLFIFIVLQSQKQIDPFFAPLTIMLVACCIPTQYKSDPLLFITAFTCDIYTLL